MPNLKSQSAFSLIEVIIAWAILSFLLLGIVALEINALESSNTAYQTSMATERLQSLLEDFQVNQTQVARAREFHLWNQENQYYLPTPDGRYRCNNQYCTVQLSWKKKEYHEIKMSGY